jgi:hypothetical protein
MSTTSTLPGGGWRIPPLDFLSPLWTLYIPAVFIASDLTEPHSTERASLRRAHSADNMRPK